MRTHWRDWAKLVAAILVSLVLVMVTTGVSQLLFAAVIGALVTIVVVGWMIGGHVRSLPSV